ncbi:MAG: hypothetical protein QOD59_5003, partial [Mycobacterium sp.]|nr:hypothetical protein [Mycobacterium sp.]
ASGDTKVAFAITEPDAGSNTRQITTMATRDGDDYLLNGTKYYISGVDEAAALIVVARSAPDKRSLCLVPTDAPGLIKHRLPGASPSLRSSSRCTSMMSAYRPAALSAPSTMAFDRCSTG